MKAKQTIHALTDKKGVIVGGILTSAKDRKGKGGPHSDRPDEGSASVGSLDAA